MLNRLLRRHFITFLLCQESSQELGIELAFFHLLDAHLIALAPTYTERTSSKPKRSIGMGIYRKDACMDILCLLEGFGLINQELEKLAHQGISIGGKDFRMELGTDNLTARVGLNHFGYTIVRPTYNLQARSQLLNSLMMEGIHLNFFLAQNLMHHATFHDRYAMSSHGARFFLTMVDVRRLFGRQVLIKSTAHSHINQLKTTTDAQSRDVTVGSQLEECQIVCVTSYIHFTQLLVFFFTEIGRSKVLATREYNTVQLSHNLTKHFHIIGHRDEVRNTPMHQDRVDVSIVDRIFGFVPSQRDTNQRLFTHHRTLCIIRMLIKLLQFRCVWRHTLSLCLHIAHTSQGQQCKQ